MLRIRIEAPDVHEMHMRDSNPRAPLVCVPMYNAPHTVKMKPAEISRLMFTDA